MIERLFTRNYLGKAEVDVAGKSIWGYKPLDNLLTPEGQLGQAPYALVQQGERQGQATAH